jgi:two-component system NtrC family sensor kinase
MTLRVPASLKLTVPLILLGFAATLSTINVLYHVPEAERAVEQEARKRLAQEMSRLQSTLEYFLLKGDLSAAQREIAVQAHHHDVTLAALIDDRNTVIAATRRAWLGRPMADVLPGFETAAASASYDDRPGMTIDASAGELLGHARILLGSEQAELRPSRSGSVLLAYDLKRHKAEARAQVLRQSLYWAGWVTALALCMWLVFHFLLTRRTRRLVRAAEDFASGNLAARGDLKGTDELGRLSRAFDAMARNVADTQTRLRRDIAERMRVQRELEASEEQYHAMFNASTDGLALWNADGAIVDVNPALRRIYGYEQRDDPSRGTGGPAYPPEFLRAVAAGESLHIELEGTRRDGSVIDLDVHGVPMQYQGKPHVLTITRDVTEKKRSAAELARQKEVLHQREKLAALGSLLAGVAHELNNPLSVVVARAYMLEEQGDDATAAAALKIRTAAERCSRIVRTFLAMARQQRPERGPVAINEVISAALDMTAYAVRTSSIDVSLSLAEDVPLVLADADQLHQVVLNLVINAQQALQDHPGPRRVRIESRFDAGAKRAVVTVADNGPGIPADVRARVFEPYFTTKPIGVGTGVGLAVSLGIVEAHGGSLTVECPVEGGAVFVMALPVDAHRAAADEPVVPQRESARSLSVLVVDDEAEIREMLTEILTVARHRVASASSGREALQRIAAERYDAILTDIRMPDLDGRDLYRHIAREWPTLAERVAFVTGDTLTSTLREFVAGSGRPVLEKPFLPSDVRRVVAALAAQEDAVRPIPSR